MADSSRVCGLLVVVLDTNPVWWGQQLLKANREVNIFIQRIFVQSPSPTVSGTFHRANWRQIWQLSTCAIHTGLELTFVLDSLYCISI